MRTSYYAIYFEYELIDWDGNWQRQRIRLTLNKYKLCGSKGDKGAYGRNDQDTRTFQNFEETNCINFKC